MTTFKVGDKVEHRTFGAGEIVFGPYDTDYYVLKRTNGDHAQVRAEAMTSAPAFAVGDKAKLYRYPEPVTVVAGPFTNRYHTWYAIDSSHIDGVTTASADELTALETAPVSTFTHDGITYDLTAEYRDSSGDVWQFSRDKVSGPDTEDNNDDGTPLARYRYSSSLDFAGRAWAWSLAEAVRAWSPLTKITDAGNTHTYDGITYDLTATYRDVDGDVWKLARVDGVVRAGIGRPIRASSNPLTDVVDNYGPLRKV